MIRALLLSLALFGLCAPTLASAQTKGVTLKRGKSPLKIAPKKGKKKPAKGQLSKEERKRRMAEGVEVLGFEVGPVAKLAELKIKTVGQLVKASAKRLVPVFGRATTAKMKKVAGDYAKGMAESSKEGKPGTKKRRDEGDRRGGRRGGKAPKLRK